MQTLLNNTQQDLWYMKSTTGYHKAGARCVHLVDSMLVPACGHQGGGMHRSHQTPQTFKHMPRTSFDSASSGLVRSFNANAPRSFASMFEEQKRPSQST